MTSDRRVRCQGAVVKEGYLLLVKHINHRTGNVYWWLPGGGMEQDETQEDCTVREVWEETHLRVQVERLLFETEDTTNQYTYRKFATYLCTPLSGDPQPGDEKSTSHSILSLGWYPLWDERTWEAGFYEEHLYPLLKRIREALK